MPFYYIFCRDRSAVERVNEIFSLLDGKTQFIWNELKDGYDTIVFLNDLRIMQMLYYLSKSNKAVIFKRIR